MSPIIKDTYIWLLCGHLVEDLYVFNGRVLKSYITTPTKNLQSYLLKNENTD